MTNIEERFHDAIDWLYERNYHLAEQVSKLGYPDLISGYPSTAGVSWDAERKRVKFVFNADFCSQINDEEFYFIVAHEALHVINGHIFILKSMYDKLKNKDRLDEMQKFSQKFGRAADCVINDSLVNLYNMPQIKLPEGSVGKILYGKEIVNTDCHELSVDDVMKLLPEEEEEEFEDNHQQWQSFFDGNGDIHKDFIEKIINFVNEAEENSSFSGQESESLDHLKEIMSESSDVASRKAGRELKSGQKKIEAINAKLNWDKILHNKVARGKMEDKWNRPNRKLISIYPDILLPSSKEKEVEEIFIAIDVSASIDRKALNLFTSLVKNTPKHFKLSAITFDMACHPFDIKHDTVKTGGGTNFGIIEEYIQENLKKYPKAIFVLTDGKGTKINPQFPNRWTWLLYGSSSQEFCKNMSNYELRTLLK